MNQKTVALENAELTARLFGSFDINVRMIERAFDVSIQNREGDECDAITVKGEDDTFIKGYAESATLALCLDEDEEAALLKLCTRVARGK